jgi:hypothetical protein
MNWPASRFLLTMTFGIAEAEKYERIFVPELKGPLMQTGQAIPPAKSVPFG